MRNNVFTLLILLLLAFSPAGAQDAEPAQKLPKQEEEKAATPAAANIPVKMEIAEAAWQQHGLISDQASGALPADTFDEKTFQEIQDILQKMPLEQTQSRLQRPLQRRVLLSQYTLKTATAKDGDTVAEDFLKLRLDSLMRAGLFEEVVSYYNAIPEEDRPAYIYPIAFTAMSGLARFSIECLELKAMDQDKQSQDSVLKQIDSFCNHLLKASSNAKDEPVMKETSEAPTMSGEFQAVNQLRSPSMKQASKSFLSEQGVKKPLPLADFGTMDVVTAQALNLADMITYPKPQLLREQLLALPAAHIAMLLAAAPKDDALRFAINAAALERGQISGNDLGKIFRILSAPRKNTAPDGKPLWEQLVIYKYKLQNAAKTPEQVAILSAVLTKFPEVSSAYGIGAITPFLSDFEANIANLNLSAASARTLLAAMLHAGAGESETLRTLAATALGFQGTVFDLEELADFLARPETKAVDNHCYSAELVSGLSALSASDEIKKVYYGKFNSLTSSKDYVMPNGDDVENLKRALDSSDVGDFTLSSLQVLGGKMIMRYDPSIAALILHGYKSVGYEREAQQYLSDILSNLLANATNKGV